MKLLTALVVLFSLSSQWSLQPGSVGKIKVGCVAVKDNVFLRAPELPEGQEYHQIAIRANGELLPTYALTNTFYFVWTRACKGTIDAKINGRPVHGHWSRLKPFRRPR